MRIRASILATAIAEGFRNEGQKVLLLMDSLTCFAMAQREIGLASGNTCIVWLCSSVFSLLPKLLKGLEQASKVPLLHLHRSC